MQPSLQLSLQLSFGSAIELRSSADADGRKRCFGGNLAAFQRASQPPSALSLPFFLGAPMSAFLHSLYLTGATARTGGGVRQVALPRHLLQGGARQGHQAQRGQDSGQEEVELIDMIRIITNTTDDLILKSCVNIEKIFVIHCEAWFLDAMI